MGKESIARPSRPCKDKNGGREAPHPSASPPPSPRGRQGRGFTASELAELARADAALEAEEIFLTKEERALSAALDREARAEAPHPPASPPPSPRGRRETRAEGRKDGGTAAAGSPHPPPSGAPSPRGRQEARLEKKRLWREAHREQLRAYYAKYNAAHRQERRDYQRAYDAAHRAEISAKRKARRAEKRKEKEHGQ